MEKGKALAQGAYYMYNQKSLQQVYDDHYCQNNCGFHVDPVGVPYLVHREDMTKIAPLWRDITVQMYKVLIMNARAKKGSIRSAVFAELDHHQRPVGHQDPVLTRLLCPLLVGRT